MHVMMLSIYLGSLLRTLAAVVHAAALLSPRTGCSLFTSKVVAPIKPIILKSDEK
jgi:hypothetical protein